MNSNIVCVHQQLKCILLLIHVFMIYLCMMIYSKEKINSIVFIPTNCQINETLTQRVPCLIKKQINKSSEINKLCKRTFYGIIYANNQFLYDDLLPTWMSPIDAENLSKIPMNITCYHSRLNQSLIRWTKPDPKGFIQLIIFSCIASFLILTSFFLSIV